MLCTMAGMVHKDSCSGMARLVLLVTVHLALFSLHWFAGLRTKRTVAVAGTMLALLVTMHLALCSLVGRPMMFNITAAMDPKDSCDMMPLFDCRKLRSLRSCSPSRSLTSLSSRRGRSPRVQAFADH